MEIITYRGALTYDEILPLEVACFGEGAVTKAQFDERMALPYWTVRAGGALVGFANGNLRADALNITHVEVAPGHRRRGIARRLLDAARTFARESGAAQLSLRVRDGNAPAHTLYLSYGFRETGRCLHRFACPTEKLPTHTDIRAEKCADGYKYPVRFLRGEVELGGGIFNIEVSGIRDISLGDPQADLLPALAALLPQLKPASATIHVMTDDKTIGRACTDQGLTLQSAFLDMIYFLAPPALRGPGGGAPR